MRVSLRQLKKIGIALMNEQETEIVVKDFRARNYRAALTWLLAFAVAVVVATLRIRSALGWMAALVAVVSAQAIYTFLRGVRLGADGVSFPRPLARFFPLAVFGQVTVMYSMLRDLTSIQKLWGFEVVVFTTADGAFPVLFASRKAKLAAFDAIKAHHPRIRIYRSV